MSDFRPGLEGVVAFETEIAEPDRAGGSLRYRGVDIEDLIGQVSFGDVWGLLVDGKFGPGLPRPGPGVGDRALVRRPGRPRPRPAGRPAEGHRQGRDDRRAVHASVAG